MLGTNRDGIWLKKMEGSKDSDVIVAPELGIPGAEEELEEERLRKGPAKKAKKGKRPKAREDAVEAGEATKKSLSVADEEANVGEGSDINARMQNDGDDGAGTWTTVKRKKHFPFQKEMKMREAARLEREKERQRIKEEMEAYRRRREESRKARKKEVRRTSCGPVHYIFLSSLLLTYFNVYLLFTLRAGEAISESDTKRPAGAQTSY